MKPVPPEEFAATAPAEPLTYAPKRARSPAQAQSEREAEARIKAHLPLVRKIAWHVHGRVANSVDIEDLIQIGMVALIEAARAYEDRGHAFATYASMRIRGSMIDALRRQAHIARSAMATRRTLAETRRRLENRLGHAASDSDMAAEMGLSAQAYRALIDGAADVKQESIDEVYSDHSIWFADREEAADDMIIREQLQASLAQAIGRLPEREAMVLQLYFVEEMNLDEIGETLGVGAARICQIKKAALDKVRVMLAE